MNYNFKEIEQTANKLAREAAYNQLKLLQAKGPAYEILDGNERVVDQLLDLCGNAYIEFKDKRSSFYRQYKKYLFENNRLNKFNDLNTFGFISTGRQEHSVNEAATEAVYNYLTSTFNVIFKISVYF